MPKHLLWIVLAACFSVSLGADEGMRRCARKITLPAGISVSIMSPTPTTYLREAHGRVIELAPGERLAVRDLYLSTSQLEIVVQLNEVAEIAKLDAIFSFRGCDPLDDHGMALLAQLHGLESLRIDSLGDVTDRGFRQLKRLPHLRCLKLAGFKRVTPVGWSVIPTIRTLEELAFYKTPSLTGPDVIGLASLPRLRRLELEKLPDCALVSLASCPALEDLSVSKSGVRMLFGALSGATNLKRLELSRCEGLDPSSLSELCNTSDLEELEFEKCPRLTDAALSRLASMQRLKKLTLEDCAAVRGEFLAAFHNHAALCELTLRQDFADEQLATLGELESLKILCLIPPKPYSAAAMKMIVRAPALEELTGYGVEFSEEVFKELAKRGSLSFLRLHDCAGVDSDGVRHLAQLKHLRLLDLSGCKKVGDRALKALVACESLEDLDLSCTGITDKGLSYIEKMPRLSGLDICGTGTTYEGMIDICQSATLRFIRAIDCPFGVDEEWLREPMHEIWTGTWSDFQITLIEWKDGECHTRTDYYEPANSDPGGRDYEPPPPADPDFEPDEK